MTRTPDEYKRRIEALGFTPPEWYKLVNIDRTTHFRHLQGTRTIPKTLWRILEWIETGQLKLK